MEKKSSVGLIVILLLILPLVCFAQGAAEEAANKGKEYVNKEKTDKAMAEFDKAIEINPNNIDVYCNRALIYEANGLYDQALSDYNRALEINPQYTWALFKKAILLDKTGCINEAIEVYKEFIPHAEKEDSLSTKPLNPGWIPAIKNAKKRIAVLEKTASIPK